LLITTFNRTAYGIEIANTKSFPLLIFFLLIAPLMELKSHTLFPMQFLLYTFNRTAYGIEILGHRTDTTRQNAFNRTAYGIEMGVS